MLQAQEIEVFSPVRTGMWLGVALTVWVGAFLFVLSKLWVQSRHLLRIERILLANRKSGKIEFDD
jgi:hypothetical protein